MKYTQLIDLFQRARKDPQLAVVEGVQALKHAARFQAKLIHIVTCDLDQLEAFLTELAPDVKAHIMSIVESVDSEIFNQLSPQPPRTQVIAIARRVSYNLKKIEVLKPLVLLEDPRDLENIGAVIRVSAAADIAGVCITGPADIWHPAVIRGAAGLHWALPVINIEVEDCAHLNRPLIALDPAGKSSDEVQIPANTVLIFGTERHGISKNLLTKSDEIIRLPMKAGVSSLNLATTVAATLYSIR